MDKYTLDGQLKFWLLSVSREYYYGTPLLYEIPCKYSANNLYNQLSQIDNTFWGRS